MKFLALAAIAIAGLTSSTQAMPMSETSETASPTIFKASMHPHVLATAGTNGEPACAYVQTSKSAIFVELDGSCDECPAATIQLTPEAYALIADEETDRANIQWMFVPCHNNTLGLVEEGSADVAAKLVEPEEVKPSKTSRKCKPKSVVHTPVATPLVTPIVTPIYEPEEIPEAVVDALNGDEVGAPVAPVAPACQDACQQAHKQPHCQCPHAHQQMAVDSEIAEPVIATPTTSGPTVTVTVIVTVPIVACPPPPMPMRRVPHFPMMPCPPYAHCPVQHAAPTHNFVADAAAPSATIAVPTGSDQVISTPVA